MAGRLPSIASRDVQTGEMQGLGNVRNMEILAGIVESLTTKKMQDEVHELRSYHEGQHQTGNQII